MDASRLAYWNDRLSPIRPGWEPINIQLGRVFGTKIVGSVLFGLIGAIIGIIFVGFGSTGLGLGFFLFIGIVPAVGRFISYVRLHRTVAIYLAEMGKSIDDNVPPN